MFLPGLAAVARLDEAEVGRRARVVGVRVPGADETVRGDDGEAHDVLGAVADAAHLPLAARGLEEPDVGGDVERSVVWVDAEAVDVVDALGLPRGLLLGGLLSGRLARGVIAAAGGDADGEQQRQQGRGQRGCPTHAASYYPA
jgi:hypothetical protein